MVHICTVFLARSECEVNKKGEATFHDTNIEISMHLIIIIIIIN